MSERSQLELLKRDLPNAAPFDPTILMERVGGDALLAAEVIGLFLEDCPSQLEMLLAAIRSSDAARLQSTAHNLKGAAATLGALAVVEAAVAIESVALEVRLADAPAAFRRLEEEAATCLAALRTCNLATLQEIVCAS